MFISGKSHQRLAELHERYGHIVRVGPNELSYIQPEAWDAIMGRRKGYSENPKPHWYCNPDNKDIVGAPRNDHARMRRLLSHGFSANAMAQQEPLINRYVDLLVERLREKAKTGTGVVDVSSWYNYCLFDLIGDLSFGEHFGCLDGSTMHPWVALIFANIRTTAIGAALSRFSLLRIVLPLILPRKLQQQAYELKRLAREKVARRLAVTDPRPDFIEAMASGKGDQVRKIIPHSKTFRNMVYGYADVSIPLGAHRRGD